jgi:organic radical activating enzyme
MISKTFCSRPFVHGLIDTNGKIRACCRITDNTEFNGNANYNINNNSVDSWWTSEYMQYLRDNMLQGNHLTECRRCYRQEEQNSISFRQRSNKDFGIVTTPDPLPRDWELQITNLCNLKCMMCNGSNSSSLLTENIEMFKVENTQPKYERNQFALDEMINIFNNLSSAVLRGGEPFMVPWIKKTLSEFPEDRAKNVELLFNTNLTKLTAEWIPILSKFKNIKISSSIDAHGPLNYYIRYPAKWEEIQAGLAVARLLPNANIFLNVCVQNLNILNLDELLVWAHTENLYVVLDVLTEPRMFEPTNLPNKLIQQAISKLESVKSVVDLSSISNFDGVLNMLYAAPQFSADWDTFVGYVKAKDLHRNVDVNNFIPEFKEYINNTVAIDFKTCYNIL